MQLAGIELRYLVNDIGQKTEDYYVANIYGISKDSLLFKFRHPENPDVLLMLSTSGIWVTKVKIDQIEPNKLLRRLRSDLLRSKLKEIKQICAPLKDSPDHNVTPFVHIMELEFFFE